MFPYYLTSTNCRAEYIGVFPIVIAELELSNIERHVFGADLMERADDPALEDRPETLNRVRVNRADDILPGGMVNGAVRISEHAEVVIDAAMIGREQANFVRDGFANESFGGLFGDVLQDASDDAALAADCTDDGRLTARAAMDASLAAVLVDALATDVGLVNLDNATKLSLGLNQSSPDAMGHVPAGFERTEAHVAIQLPRAHSLLAGQHQMRDFEPVAERLVGILEDRSDQNGEPIAVRGALLALPMPLAGFEFIDGGIATARANRPFGPAAGFEIPFAGVLVPDGKSSVKFGAGHLMDRLGTPFGPRSHGKPSRMMEGY
jgi:hypothetical protein